MARYTHHPRPTWKKSWITAAMSSSDAPEEQQDNTIQTEVVAVVVPHMGRPLKPIIGHGDKELNRPGYDREDKKERFKSWYLSPLFLMRK